jgi:hypothetical protein
VGVGVGGVAAGPCAAAPECAVSAMFEADVAAVEEEASVVASAASVRPRLAQVAHRTAAVTPAVPYSHRGAARLEISATRPSVDDPFVD